MACMDIDLDFSSEYLQQQQKQQQYQSNIFIRVGIILLYSYIRLE